MQVVKLHAVGTQSPQALLALLPQRCRPGVQHLLAVRRPVNSAFGGDHHFLAAAAQRPCDQPFALPVGTVAIGGIQMVDSHVEAGLDRGNAVGIGYPRACHARDRPAAQGHFRDL